MLNFYNIYNSPEILQAYFYKYFHKVNIFLTKAFLNIFFSICNLSLKSIPFHGNIPVYKLINICPIDSKSSLLLCSTPLDAFYDAYLSVPNILPVKENFTCFKVLELRYFFARPKSIKYIVHKSS